MTVIDTSVPDLRAVLTPRLGVDAESFKQWLAPHLGRYRHAEELRGQMLSRQDELVELDAVAKTLATCQARLGPGGMSPVAEALIADELYRARGEHLHELCERIAADIALLQALTERARATVARAEPRRGRRSETHRDALLTLVVERLRSEGLQVAVAERVAEDVLIACRVPVPGHGDSMARAVRRGRGQK